MRGRAFSAVIIGGGFSGAVAAIKLLDIVAARPLRISIVEPRAELGLGLAFSSRDPVHFLNGPARLFSIHADHPDHLVRWLSVQDEASTIPLPPSGQLSDAFVPRRLYGAYVQSDLARAIAEVGGDGRVDHIRAEATDIEQTEAGAQVVLSDGRSLSADLVLLATGFAINKPRFEVTAAPGSHYLDNPWSLASHEADGTLPRSGTALFIGGGLTMLDALMSLERSGFTGRYISVSRHGLLVNERREPPLARDFLAPGLPETARDLLRLAREEIDTLRAEGGDWQSIVPVIRTRLSELWAAARPEERARFNRHLRRFWELALHRAPGPSHATFSSVLAQGRIAARAGRVEAIVADPNGAVVRLRPRGGSASEEVRADLVVNCTGAEYAWPRQTGALPHNLLRRGLVRPGGLGYGIDADTNAAAIDAAGTPSSFLFGIGPVLRGTRWESTTISEIVAQATALAGHLADTRLSRRALATAA